jgi:hypothetical protein
MAAGENGQRQRNRNNEIMKKKRSAKWRGSEIISKWHGKYRRNKSGMKTLQYQSKSVMASISGGEEKQWHGDQQ